MELNAVIRNPFNKCVTLTPSHRHFLGFIQGTFTIVTQSNAVIVFSNDIILTIFFQ
jgi:hypothetical protein